MKYRSWLADAGKSMERSVDCRGTTRRNSIHPHVDLFDKGNDNKIKHSESKRGRGGATEDMLVVPLLSTNRSLTNHLTSNLVYRRLEPFRLGIHHLSVRSPYHYSFSHLPAHAVSVRFRHLRPELAFLTSVVLFHMFPDKTWLIILCPFSLLSSQMLLCSGI